MPTSTGQDQAGEDRAHCPSDGWPRTSVAAEVLRRRLERIEVAFLFDSFFALLFFSPLFCCRSDLGAPRANSRGGLCAGMLSRHG